MTDSPDALLSLALDYGRLVRISDDNRGIPTNNAFRNQWEALKRKCAEVYPEGYMSLLSNYIRGYCEGGFRRGR